MFLETKDIKSDFNGAVPLYFPDVSVDAGQSVLVLGASGSGKTTFLSVIAGLHKPAQGKVFVDGADVYSMPSSRRDRFRGQNFGFVFQNMHLVASLTVRQNIELAADIIKIRVDPNRTEHLMNSLGLWALKDRKPYSLSYGEQQRVAIARAVYLKPRILIADEPTSALDDDNTRIVIDLLQQQAHEASAALLIATHDNRVKSCFKNIVTFHHTKDQ